MVQLMLKISHEQVLKEMKTLFTSVTSNISNHKMKRVVITKSQVFINIAKAILFPVNLCVCTSQPENCSVKKPEGNFQMLKTEEF